MAPEATEYPASFQRYIARVPEPDIVSAMEMEITSSARLLRGIPEAHSGFRYAPEKWSIKELAGHLADTSELSQDALSCPNQPRGSVFRGQSAIGAPQTATLAPARSLALHARLPDFIDVFQSSGPEFDFPESNS